MISIKGRWHDGRTSASDDAGCTVYDSGAVLIERLKDGKTLLERPRFDIQISPRLADTERYLVFPQGEKFATFDNDSVDRIAAQFGRRSWLDRVHKLERHYRYVLPALLLLLLFLWGWIHYGIPWTAEIIAHRLAPSVLDRAGRQTLEVLDRSLLAPSELSEHVRTQITAHFGPALAAHERFGVRVLFRKGGAAGANAFALPGGVVVFTDEMVEIAEHPDELLAVLSHEIGHVVHRHGVRTLIQDSILGFVLLAITGDVSGSSELFLGLPVLLTEMAYSRGFEREADEFALAWLKANGVPPGRFAALMRRIEGLKPDASSSNRRRWLNYLSTHPLTEERLKALEDR